MAKIGLRQERKHTFRNCLRDTHLDRKSDENSENFQSQPHPSPIPFPIPRLENVDILLFIKSQLKDSICK